MARQGNTLIIGDLHLGSGRSLAGHHRFLSILEPELRWADRLVISGDLLHVSPLRDALREAGPFCRLASGLVEEVVLIPGNHEAWLTQQSRQRRLLGAENEIALLEKLFPGPQLRMEGPHLDLGGASVLHGHQVAAQLQSPEPLTLEECDRRLEPLLSASWALAQDPQPKSREIEEAIERAAGRLTAPGSPRTRPIDEVLAALAMSCQASRVPEGHLIIGHLHQQVEARRSGPYTFHSPGAWVYDQFIKDRDPDPRSAHPGGVIRLSDGRLEHRRLLDHLGWDELEPRQPEA